MAQIVDYRLALVAEDANGEIVAFTLAIPNINEVLAQITSGRLFLTGLARLIWALKRHTLKSCRVITMGTKPAWRNKGVDVLLHVEQVLAGRQMGLDNAELSQVLETNKNMLRIAERVGGHIVMTHRLFERKMSCQVVAGDREPRRRNAE